MKEKFYFLLAFLTFAFSAAFSQYNHEWIVPGKQYYKFKIGTTGLYRLDNAFFSSLGIAGVDKSQLQLWRNGKQVPLFTSSDFVEFWGEKNDGATDEKLFQSPLQQMDKRKSLHSDSATFFLTINSNTAQNIRFSTAANNVAAKPAALAAEPYFLFKSYLNSGTTFNYGPFSPYISEPVYDSRYYNKSFGWQVTPSSAYTLNFSNLYANSAVPAKLTISVSGMSLVGGSRTVKATVAGTDVISEQLNTLQSKFMTGSIALNGDIAVTVSDIPATGNVNAAADRIMLNYGELEYARNFNFGAESKFAFTLQGNGQPKFLEIANFNAGGTTPVLYDLANNLRYSAVANGNVFQFFLPSVNAEHHFVLVSQAATAFSSVNAAQTTIRTFPDFADITNQAVFAIISNKALYGEGNYVQQYADYRSSVQGGGYNTHIYDIDILEDMFAFGIKGHPFSIKNFLRFAQSSFSVKPQFALLIGRGLPFYQNKQQESNPTYQQMNFVPTYGYPGSDIMLAAAGIDPIPTLNISRISVVKPIEIKIYLDKLKQYEATQKFSDFSIAANSWKKNTIFATGGNNEYEGRLFDSYMSAYRKILTDTLLGVKDFNYSKTSTGSVSGNLSNSELQRLIAGGVGLISYYGHGASTTLGYQELSTPLPYTFNGKYPIFITSGCDVGDYFSFINGRMTNLNNIPESYLFTPDKGAVAFMAQSYLGVTSYLDMYNKIFYKQLAVDNYGKPLFESMKVSSAGMIDLLRRFSNVDSICYYSHAAQTNLLGDPAVQIFYGDKPDFVAEQNQVIAPSAISYTEDKFLLKAYLYNIGKASGDSLSVLISRSLPNGTSETVLATKIKAIRNMDSVLVEVPIAGQEKYIGNNDFSITIDSDAQYDELSEANNTAIKRVVVFSDGILPVYPYKYAIIDNPTAKLVASTSDPLAAAKQYIMEIDTTEMFNSPAKITKSMTSKGGALEFDPGISYVNGTVYYWRVSAAPTAGGEFRWSYANFQYLAGRGEGAGQAHFYQHLKSNFSNIDLDSSSRLWNFATISFPIDINNAVVGGGNTSGLSDFLVNLNKNLIASFYCTSVGNSMIFNVIDPTSLKPYFNQATPATTENGTIGGFMGAVSACGSTPYSYDRNATTNSNKYTFQFPFSSKENRDNIANFMDWIPNGAYVIARMIIVPPFANVPLVDTWKNDGGNSMYSQFIQQGISQIDNINSPKIGVFIFKKNDRSFVPIQQVSADQYGKIQLRGVEITGKDSTGTITSPTFGPAAQWKTLEWDGNALENNAGDDANINVIGIDRQGNKTTLANIPNNQTSFDISNINANNYPFLQLQMNNKDATNNTPLQLNFWRILYNTLPEGAVTPNVSFSIPDSIQQGQDLKILMSFKNVSSQQFSDSLINRITLIGSNNVSHNIPAEKVKKLTPGESQNIEITIPGDTASYNALVSASNMKMPIGTKNLNGNIVIGIDVNPGLQVPEEMHENNTLFKTVTVNHENSLANMEVTFDGVHILDNDIVSSKPNIAIRLSDASKNILVKDTASVKVMLRYPSGQIKTFNYRSDTLQFFGAQNSDKNEALVDFKPYLTEDGTYQLSITGLNADNPNASPVNYTVSFMVYNKPMITDMFNYPNPFTTSTAFVFTLTGSQVPQNLRIQILTITGKIVKEITKQELGNITIGRNITEYKWDGTDQYGQKLANGVYLYRVITNQDGKKLDRLDVKDSNGNTINTSQYFNKGYGKMYLMR